MQLLTDSDSVSEIVRASAIFLFTVQNVTTGAWEPEEESSLRRRELVLTINIDEVLKGTLAQEVGLPFKIHGEQRGTGGIATMDYYGLWSHIELEPGQKLIAFCPGESEDVTELLTDEGCEQLVEPKGVLDDIRTALRIGSETDHPDELLSAAAELTARRGEVFARWVVAMSRHPTVTEELELVSEESQDVASTRHRFFDLMSLMENPETSPSARRAYLTSVFEEVSMTTAPSLEQKIAFARTMFRMLDLPPTASLDEALRDVYLPNLLGLEHEPPFLRPEDVFGEDAHARQKALAAVQRNPDHRSTTKLMQWLRFGD